MAIFFGLARVLSKRGFCSRAAAIEAIRAGRVTVRGRRITDPESRTNLAEEGIAVDGIAIHAVDHVARHYVVLNKPRGLVTTMSDELGRDTVFACLQDGGLPRLVPVGRLDKASEGMLLFSNDTTWADHITAPENHLRKTYHVQVKPVPDLASLAAMQAGVDTGSTGLMAVEEVEVLRSGGKTAWLEVVLVEGKNRQIRRIAETLGFEVLRLVRVAIGDLQLGDLAKGRWRHLSDVEIARLGTPAKFPLPDTPGGRNANKIGG